MNTAAKWLITIMSVAIVVLVVTLLIATRTADDPDAYIRNIAFNNGRRLAYSYFCRVCGGCCPFG